ncbi:hypothetical protein CBR64_08745 [Cellulosimicrobium cellulans]|uniref:Uncharacterized protein n=1 Tax=Cellulosimicrobium cellulans TaxID=1710 RepID=A0A1Y0HWB3_CELCE|nr:hypothetical protein CBR64_08745 [Cellulosimicrobium cellulans]
MGVRRATSPAHQHPSRSATARAAAYEEATVPDNRPLFSAPSTTTSTAPSTTAATRRPADHGATLDLRSRDEPRRRANPGDELTVDPADRRRRARAALLDLRRDVIRRSATGW